MKWWQGLTVGVVVTGVLKGVLMIGAYGVGATVGREAGKAAVEGVQHVQREAQIQDYADHRLDEVAVEVNRRMQFPQVKVEDGVRVRYEPLTAGDHVINYSFTILDFSLADAQAKGLDSASFMQSTLPALRKNDCTNAKTKMIMDHGVTLHYTYRMNDGNTLATMDVVAADCDGVNS